MELKKNLDEIIILAMGPSWALCPDEAPPNSEIWGCNTMYRNIKVDRCFIMHDVRYDVLLQDRHFKDHVNQLKLPVYTAAPHPEFDCGVQYPIAEVIEHFKVCFFLNVICYMLALAIMQKPKLITLYGCDMRTDTGMEYNKNEKGAVEFWLGAATGAKVMWRVPQESFLCKRTVTSNFYGFRARQTADGVRQLIPHPMSVIYSRYKVIPMRDDGSLVENEALITEFADPNKTGNLDV